MSAVATFALECARSGRWARGMLALQPSLPSRSPQTRHAALALALAAAPHNAEAAMGLLTGNYTAEHNTMVADTLNTIARSGNVDSAALCTVALPILVEAAHTDFEAARRLFLSATEWTGVETAAQLFTPLAATSSSLSSSPSSSASLTACRERLSLLQRCYEEDVAAYAFYFPDELPLIDAQRQSNQRIDAQYARTMRHHTVRDRRERAQLKTLRYRAARAAVQDAEQRNIVAAFEELPSWWSVAAMLRMATRVSADSFTAGRDAVVQVSWRTALTMLGKQRLLPELELPYIRCVGVCAPWMWEEAVERLGAVPLAPSVDTKDAASASATPVKALTASEARRRARLWLVSRGSVSAATVQVKQYLRAAEEWAAADAALLPVLHQRRRWGEELLSRTAVPLSTFFGLFPAKLRPSIQVGCQQPRAAIAQTLAAGARLDEIQLSAPMKEWVKEGDWPTVLAIYYRFPTAEFQRRAVESLIALVGRRGLSREHNKDAQGTDVKTMDSGLQATMLAKRPSTLADVLEAVVWVPNLQQRWTEVSLGTHCASLLISATANGAEALTILRLCVRHGTLCNPQLLSVIMDKRPSRKQLKALLKSYPGAINMGVARRAKDDFNITVSPHAANVPNLSAE